MNVGKIYREGKVERLRDSELPGPYVVHVPEEHEEDETRDDVAQPDVGQGQVVREDDRLKRGVPGHPRRAVRLLEPGHQEAEVKAEVGHQGDCDLGSDTPDKIVVRGDETKRKPGPKMEKNAESDRQIG